MQISSIAAVPRSSEPQETTQGRFLVLGGERLELPDARLGGQIGTAVAGIILAGKVDPAELDAALEAAPDPAVPIADFGSNDMLRRDLSGASLDPASLRVIEQSFAPIWRRLAEFPFRAERDERAQLAALRLAYSRDKAIEAHFAPNSHSLVEYPLLGPVTGARQLLEGLAALDLLNRRHFTRTHLCPKCDSARLHVYEACPACGGAELQEEELVHHYRCGCQEIQARFLQGEHLICPKCRRELRHLGVDYGKPGKAVMCAACGAMNSEPFMRFACLDCAAVSAPEENPSLDWYHYDLTEDGISALRHGRLPQFDIVPFLENPMPIRRANFACWRRMN